MKHSATERHVGVANVCFQETLETHRFSHSFPQTTCSFHTVTVVMVKMRYLVYANYSTTTVRYHITSVDEMVGD